MSGHRRRVGNNRCIPIGRSKHPPGYRVRNVGQFSVGKSFGGWSQVGFTVANASRRHTGARSYGFGRFRVERKTRNFVRTQVSNDKRTNRDVVLVLKTSKLVEEYTITRRRWGREYYVPRSTVRLCSINELVLMGIVLRGIGEDLRHVDRF